MSVPLLALLHLCDSLFPIGAFAYSDGLESAVNARAVCGSDDLRHLASGPGRLTQAMGITLADNRADLVTGPLYVARGSGPLGPIVATPRIGISVATDRRWRFVVRGSPFLSRRAG